MHTEVNGFILWLRCSACGEEFPTFLFSGDHDWMTAGLRTRTDLANRVLYVCEHLANAPGGSEVPLVKAEQVQPQPGESFQDYRERSKNNKGRYFYRCLACGGGYAERISSLSAGELESRGYSFVVV